MAGLAGLARVALRAGSPFFVRVLQFFAVYCQAAFIELVARYTKITLLQLAAAHSAAVVAIPQSAGSRARWVGWGTVIYVIAHMAGAASYAVSRSGVLSRL